MKPSKKLFLFGLIIFLGTVITVFILLNRANTARLIVQASPSSETTSNDVGTPEAVNNLFTLDKVIELDDGYILIGAFHSVMLDNGVNVDPQEVMDRFGTDTFNVGEHVGPFRITDAEGQEIPSDLTQEIEYPESSMDIFPWALKVEGRQIAWPLTITLHSAIGVLAEETRFEFDAGPNPQEMQLWNIDKDVETNGYHARLISIQRVTGGYQFAWTADPNVLSFGAWLEGFQEQEVGGGGGLGPDRVWTMEIYYADPIPAGKLTVVMSIELVEVEGDWSITWQPDS